MVCKHCQYFIERDKGWWTSPAKANRPALCEARHAKEGIWEHEPQVVEASILWLIPVVLLVTFLLIAGIYAFGGLK
jgi:NMD protein affecting ribosome stability and mRNA decay